MARAGHRTRQDGRSAGEGQYFTLPYATLHAPAWRSLHGASVKVFLELRSRFHGGNNGKLVFGYAEASKLLGLGKATVKRAFIELEEKGFIKLMKQGYWYGHQANEWLVTDQSHQGNPPTRDWKQWRPKAKTKDGSKTEPNRPLYVPN